MSISKKNGNGQLAGQFRIMEENKKIKRIIEILELNKKVGNEWKKTKHTEGFLAELKGLIDGYEFGIIVCKKALKKNFLKTWKI